MASGRTATDVGRDMGVSKHTIYAWSQKYGGMNSDEAKRLRHLEDENRRLKIVVADLKLDREVLKAVISKKSGLVSRRETSRSREKILRRHFKVIDSRNDVVDLQLTGSQFDRYYNLENSQIATATVAIHDRDSNSAISSPNQSAQRELPSS